MVLARLAPWLLAVGACGPGVVDPVPPTQPSPVQTALDCDGRYALPDALMGADGLGHHGFTEGMLQEFTARWGVSVAHEARWISDNTNQGPSVRVHVLRAPDVGQCVQDELIASTSSELPLHDALRGLTPWTHSEADLGGLQLDGVEPVSYDFSGGNPIYRALRGVAADPASVESDALRSVAATWPDEAQEPVARLILAIGEAAWLRNRAFSGVDAEALARIAAGLPSEDLTTTWLANLHPRKETMLPDLHMAGPEVDRGHLNAAALTLARAIDEAQVALAEVEPFEGGTLEVRSTAGRIVLRSDDQDHTTDDDDIALLLDLGGNDAYTGAVASARPELPIAVLVDVRGDDTYDPGQPDLQDPDTAATTAFTAQNSFTQGFAVGGVAVLSDGAGDDVYRASTYGQGAALLGVGVLDDRGGQDRYQIGGHGQGTAMFGLALLRDAGEGDDDYRGYTNIQGVGKPGGVGVILDEGGSDLYAALTEVQEPWLPAETSARNYLGLPASHPYSADGKPHFMSIAQGTGWGFRHEWTQPLLGRSEAWGGGFGALVDLGDGNDTHVADCFSMGQGFVYGLGMLYDGGGDDTYRMFWWGMGASAHMGVGLFWDEDGNDDLHATRASAGFGYDLGVGWVIDEGGDDTYGGQMHYGRGYLNAHTFFVNEGGDDHYNAGGVRNNPYFGVVRGADGNAPGLRLVGAFLDLGGGQDVYETEVQGPANDAVWHHEPVGKDVNPTNHIGIGIDR